MQKKKNPKNLERGVGSSLIARKKKQRSSLFLSKEFLSRLLRLLHSSHNFPPRKAEQALAALFCRKEVNRRTMPDIPAGKERRTKRNPSAVTGCRRRRFPPFFSQVEMKKKKKRKRSLAVALLFDHFDRFDRATTWRRVSRSIRLEKASIGPQGRHLCQLGEMRKVFFFFSSSCR